MPKPPEDRNLLQYYGNLPGIQFNILLTTNKQTRDGQKSGEFNRIDFTPRLMNGKII